MEEIMTSLAELVRTVNRVNNKNPEVFSKMDLNRLKSAKRLLRKHSTIDEVKILKQTTIIT